MVPPASPTPPAPTAQDQALLALLQSPATREAGFRELLRTYQERVYWHIRRIVSTHEDADDATQNTFIQVYRHVGKFEGKSQLYTWIYRIATNEALGLLRRQKRQQTFAVDNELAIEQAHQQAEDAPIDAEALQAKLTAAIAQLPEKQRLVFNMRYFDDLPYKDISAILGTSEGGLKASYHHAVKKIEAFLTA